MNEETGQRCEFTLCQTMTHCEGGRTSSLDASVSFYVKHLDTGKDMFLFFAELDARDFSVSELDASHLSPGSVTGNQALRLRYQYLCFFIVVA